ncbi:MAG: Zn-dependent hydrolase [Bacteroidales bacterium]|nr:Zn-dependent hydrolase [Bacteroidales bacterium]
MKKTALMLLAIMTIASIFQQSQAQDKRDDVASKVRQYAVYPLKYDMESLSEQDRELVTIFIQIANIMDELYWEQCFGLENKAKLESLADLNMYEYAKINYGAWDRMDGNKPFLPNYKNKPEGANFYPANMTKKEFESLKNPLKTSPYTILRRDIKGNLIVIPYSQAYSRQLMEVDMLLDKAISIAENPSLREYLMAKREALQTDDYLNSDIAWMDMKDSQLDFVFGPIENYEDGLYGYKTAYEAFVLIKDKEWSERLKHYTELLPEMQRMLPCKPEYKEERPGTNSDINVYDVIYYAGDCNAAGKTIAINLPNDEKVQLSHGTRRLQLRNAMQAKFDMIVKPIADLAISKNQQGNIKFNAFFNNVCFHEVAHGLGIKQTITGKGTVREALQNQYSAWEEAKADICGLFLVQKMIENGEIKDITVEDAYVTYVASLIRSVRFGATEAHGIANIMCFNFLNSRKAITLEKDGRYSVNIKEMNSAIAAWAERVLTTEGNGDYKAAQEYAAKNGVVRPELQKVLNKISKANIPVDIRFEQGYQILGLRNPLDRGDKKAKKAIEPKTVEIQSPTLKPKKK